MSNEKCFGLAFRINTRCNQCEDKKKCLKEYRKVIMKDKKKILPCAAYLEGEYGFNNLFIGVPVKLGANGIEEIIEITLTDEEQTALAKSADAVRELVEAMKKL